MGKRKESRSPQDSRNVVPILPGNNPASRKTSKSLIGKIGSFGAALFLAVSFFLYESGQTRLVSGNLKQIIVPVDIIVLSLVTMDLSILNTLGFTDMFPNLNCIHKRNFRKK
jgi:hypothetical protein